MGSPVQHTPSTSCRSHASFVVHGACAEHQWKMECQRERAAFDTCSHHKSAQNPSRPRVASQSKRAFCSSYVAPLASANLERNLQVIVCGELVPPNSPRLICSSSSHTCLQTRSPPPLPPPPPPPFNLDTANLKIAARSLRHLTLSPSSGAPVQTFYALTGNHPEPSISVLVVLSGSCSSAVCSENAAALCAERTSVPTRHCSGH